MLTWLLYGAYGKTGRLILDEALRRGHAAGPYEVTGPLMGGACLDAGCSCLDLKAQELH